MNHSQQAFGSCGDGSEIPVTDSAPLSGQHSWARISTEIRYLTDDCVTRFYLSRMRPMRAAHRILLREIDHLNAKCPIHPPRRAPSLSYLRSRIHSLHPYDVIFPREGGKAAQRWLRKTVRRLAYKDGHYA